MPTGCTMDVLYTLNWHLKKKSVYNERWDLTAPWVQTYTLSPSLACGEWWMEAIYAFLGEIIIIAKDFICSEKN